MLVKIIVVDGEKSQYQMQTEVLGENVLSEWVLRRTSQKKTPPHPPLLNRNTYEIST